ncbi:MAG: hypothetical protein ACD_16C00043G0004 [uncultured bacterium]|nr:MAG: hypothetical protein ACD_16C00043G0004 [uncultured bacterium]OFW68407.1 MAG: hypothetical protein A2X70_06880 [Alphaproteobacteria bacterium GWC2_42_16]OFW73041.1 MAG: hypothetical protein A2Z80_07375 [Alphaproteobacteria bacterium GWA2_41_27]OFW81499.1 MAG: hypothetical protein A3E50_05850 [Alphaproteobacteria bacterium RIFCSPHIGHO2_12_FULL_42_100]OFW85242.1 MAG: hypothetical protein A2W06_07495 [Alphaproteobacteria bacterium RBG_16_42_14]OFW91077.1 MAG: hypothetical protein A2W46_056
MRKLLNELRNDLSLICPTHIQRPEEVFFPHITLVPEQSLYGVPWGPRIACISIKLWSRYAGTLEILRLGYEVEQRLYAFSPFSLKLMESSLHLLKDERTRLYKLRLKALLPGRNV